jgi:hypothetical protein
MVEKGTKLRTRGFSSFVGFYARRLGFGRCSRGVVGGSLRPHWVLDLPYGSAGAKLLGEQSGRLAEAVQCLNELSLVGSLEHRSGLGHDGAESGPCGDAALVSLSRGLRGRRHGRRRAGLDKRVEVGMADAPPPFANPDRRKLAAVKPLSGLPGYAELVPPERAGSGNLAPAGSDNPSASAQAMTSSEDLWRAAGTSPIRKRRPDSGRRRAASCLSQPPDRVHDPPALGHPNELKQVNVAMAEARDAGDLSAQA